MSIPKRYVPKTLSKRDKKKQKKMIQKSRKDYKKKFIKQEKELIRLNQRNRNTF